MLNLRDIYFDSYNFTRQIKDAINSILFKAEDPGILAQVLCSEIYYNFLSPMQENIRNIGSELNLYSSNSEIAARLNAQNSEINMLKYKVDSLEKELKEIRDLLESRLEFA